MAHTTSRNLDAINGRYIMPFSQLKELNDSTRTSYSIEDDMEYYEFFSKELILMFSNVPDNYYREMIQRRHSDLDREEKTTERFNKYIVMPHFVEEQESYITNNHFNFEYLSQLDDNSLFGFIRSIGPAKTNELLISVPRNYDELYNRINEMNNIWLNAYINGISYLVNQYKTDMIPFLLSEDDLQSIFFSGMSVLRSYMIIKDNDTVDTIQKDMSQALLLMNRLSDITQYMVDNHIISSNNYNWFLEYPKRFADQFEYRLQTIGSERSGSERHKQILL